MRKGGFFRGVIENLRSTVSQPSSAVTGAKVLHDAESEEQLKPEHFRIETIVRHGFPYQPTAIAFDPVQRLVAIGTKNGSLRILGRPGVDIGVRHVTEFAVLQIHFIINDGQLITVCADDSLHLWNLRTKKPEIVQSLKFKKERITFTHMAFQSKWLYIGSDRGNVHVLNIETFSLSGYVINWNKAIELSCKSHPGVIIHLSDCPIDSNKLLIGYESGIVVLWDLRNKAPDFRQTCNEVIRSISWHTEGRQFICAHRDGSLSTWNVKSGSRPQSSIYPHSKSIGTEHRPEPCQPIGKVEWRTVRNGDAYIMFSGGMPTENGQVNSSQTLTVIHGKSTTVLEMEHDIVDFISLCESPFEADYNDPYAIVVLLSKDLVVVDLQTPGYPCFQNPYPMDLHESPVTYCYYLADCPLDLVSAFVTVGNKLNRRAGFSDREWPISGGKWGIETMSYPEIIITGHADGSLKFWDATSVHLQVLYKHKTAKLFEKPRSIGSNGTSSNVPELEDLFAIDFVTFSPETRHLCVAGACSQVIVFRFHRQETQSEVAIIDVPMNYDDLDQNADSEIQSGTSSLLQQADKDGGCGSSIYTLRARTGQHKRLSGFQAELVCITPWIDRRTAPYRIVTMCHNAHANLLAYGTENSLVIIDLIQKSIVLNVSTASLYGPSDPIARSRQKRCTSAGANSKENDNGEVDRCRSPIIENSPSPVLPENSSEVTQIGLEHALSLPHLEASSSSQHQSTEESIAEIDSIIAQAEQLSAMLKKSNLAPIAPPRYKRNKKSLLKQKPKVKDGFSLVRVPSRIGHKDNDEDEDDEEKEQEEAEVMSPTESEESKVVSTSAEESIDGLEVASNVIESLQSPSEMIQVSHEANQHGSEQIESPAERELSDLSSALISSPTTAFTGEAHSDSGVSASLELDLTVPPTPTSTAISTPSVTSTATTPSSAVLDPYEGFRRFRYSTKQKKLIDLRQEESSVSDLIRHKLDSFSRSRSSSMSSLENVGSESVHFLTFANTFVQKHDNVPTTTLWVGTSCGSVIAIALTMTDSLDNRELCLETVVAVPTPTIFRLKGAILNITFLDASGASLPILPEMWKDKNRPGSAAISGSTGSGTDSRRSTSLSITRTGSGGVTPASSLGSGSSAAGSKGTKISPTSSSSDFREAHFAVITSNSQVRLVVMPQQFCAQKATITETSFAVRADVIYMKSQESNCLCVYLGTGNIIVYSLPSLRPLIDIDFLPLTDVRIARTFFFSTNGHGIYMSSPSEVTKFTISAALSDMLPEMLGTVYSAPKDLPEPPKQSFLKGLFGGASQVDREELFGESAAGKALKTTAMHIPGSSNAEGMKAGAQFGGEFAKLREGLNERTERLGKLEDNTEKMRAEAEAFGSLAHNVMLKYRDKKWYQF